MKRRRILIVFLLVGLATLVAGVVTLPSLLTSIVNRRLGKVPGYEGGVKRVHVHWSKLRLTAVHLRLNKRERISPAVFLTADEVGLKLSIRRLLRGQLSLTLTLENPKITFLIRQRKVNEPPRFGRWQVFFATLPPFRMDALALRNGSVEIRNNESLPPLVVSLDGIELTASNMANRGRLMRPEPARLEGRGFLSGAPVWVSLEAEPFKEHASFHLKGGLTNFNLVGLNDTLHYYTHLDLKNGFLTMTGDFVAQNGAFEGRVHRALTDIDVRRARKTMMKDIKEFIFQTWIDGQQSSPNHIENDFHLSGPLGYMDKDLFLASTWAASRSFLQSLNPKLPPQVRLSTPEATQALWMETQARALTKRNAKIRRDERKRVEKQ